MSSRGFTERPGPQPENPGPPPGPATWKRSDAWDEAAIPARPWLAPGYLLRGTVTLVLGAGGVSKSSLVLAYAAALALGQPLHGMRPRGRLRAAVFNVEDASDEQQRRLSAVLTSMGRLPSDVAGWILRTGPTRTGALFEKHPLTGGIVPTAAMAQLEADLVEFGADALFLDPLAELHGVEENDNTGMRAIVAEFRALAVRLNLAVCIVHHTRKGLVVAGDADAGRGASAIVGAARVVLTLVGMTPEEAAAFGLPGDSARHYFRVDGGKANYSALASAEWFERRVYTLANEDHVAVTVPWHPPQDAITPDAQVDVEAAVRRGSPSGPLSPLMSAGPRSARHAMTAAGITTHPGQRAMLDRLMRDGFQQVRFRDARRKLVLGLRSPDGLPAAAWEDAEENAGGSDPA